MLLKASEIEAKSLSPSHACRSPLEVATVFTRTILVAETMNYVL